MFGLNLCWSCFTLNCLPASWLKLMTKKQNLIKDAYLEASQKEKLQNKHPYTHAEFEGEDDMLQYRENFHSVFSTIVLFMEHDPYTKNYNEPGFEFPDSKT